MSDKRLEGKRAVVTGASRGLGWFIARELAGAGARVIVTGRDAETLGDGAARIGGNVTAMVCDHSDESTIEEFAKRVVGDGGAPDILVNNAGVFRGRASVAEMPTELWKSVIDTNLSGVFFTTRAFLPAMIDRGAGGEIVMIASTSGLRADPGAAAYNASKFGLRGFSEALTKEVRSHDIRVNVLCPSSIDMTDPPAAEGGKGARLHAVDLARTVVHLVTLPGRTLIREMEIWGTNP
ncbi:MAG: SDR family NAD(P)-dependent oxidoreductase [Candidatus Eisenbacteria bacterium]